MTKESYFEILNTEPDIINLSKEDIEAWLDTITANAKALHDSIYTLDYGKLNVEEGEYENTIQPCSEDMYSLHIYTGIDLLAEAVGSTLVCEDRDSYEYPYQYSFEYNGVTVFQIEHKPLDGRR